MVITISYILLSLYFIIKFISSLIAFFKYSTDEINEILSIKNIKLTKMLYFYGILEHLFLLILVNLLYFKF